VVALVSGHWLLLAAIGAVSGPGIAPWVRDGLLRLGAGRADGRSTLTWWSSWRSGIAGRDRRGAVGRDPPGAVV